MQLSAARADERDDQGRKAVAMCIGIPARIISIEGDVLPNAVIDVAGQQRTCCLAYLPEAQVGD